VLVAKNFAKLGLGDAGARVLAFGASVYLARVLGADGYGVVAVAMAVTLYLSNLVDFGVETLCVQRVAGAPDRAGETAGVYLPGRLVAALVAGGVAAGTALWLLPGLEGRVVSLFLLTLVPVALSTRWVHLGLERTGAVALGRVGGEATVLVLVLVLVRGADGIAAVPVIQFLGDMLAAGWLWTRLAAAGVHVRLRWDLGRVRSYVKDAWPLVGHSLLGLVIYNSDLLFLRAFQGRAEVGWYAAAYALVSFLLNVGWAYGQSLLPTLTRLDREGGDVTGLFRTALAQVFAVILPIAVGGAMVSGGLILAVFGGDYAPAAPALAILVWSVPLSLVRSVSIVALISRERQDLVLRTTTSSAVVNLVLNLILIPRFGLLGAAGATVITEAQRAVLALVFTRRLGFPRLPVERFWKPLVAGAAMAGSLWLLPDAHVAVRIPLGAAVYAMGLFSVGALNVRGGLRLDV
jgi:O-antigen/teichoic acid export membrane protein